MSALQEVVGLLTDLLEGMPHRRLGRRRHLKLGDEPIDLLHIPIHSATLVSAHRDREVNVAGFLRNHVALARGQARAREPPAAAGSRPLIFFRRRLSRASGILRAGDAGGRLVVVSVASLRAHRDASSTDRPRPAAHTTGAYATHVTPMVKRGSRNQ